MPITMSGSRQCCDSMHSIFMPLIISPRIEGRSDLIPQRIYRLTFDARTEGVTLGLGRKSTPLVLLCPWAQLLFSSLTRKYISRRITTHQFSIVEMHSTRHVIWSQTSPCRLLGLCPAPVQ